MRRREGAGGRGARRQPEDDLQPARPARRRGGQAGILMPPRPTRRQEHDR
ncbi:hypothetical protein NMB33_36540 (plasmid) [Burkholderia sp. FXe9]|nr:hypothetical protein NMB33_36540 [Burkholderia sp. FXe9]